MNLKELNRFIGQEIKNIQTIDDSEKPSAHWFNTLVIDMDTSKIYIRTSSLLPRVYLTGPYNKSIFHGVEFVNGEIEVFTSAGSFRVYMGNSVSVESSTYDEIFRDGVQYLVVKAGDKALCVLLHHSDALIGERAVFNGQSPLLSAPMTVVVIAPDGSERTFGDPEWEFGTILTYRLISVAKGYQPKASDEAAAARA